MEEEQALVRHYFGELTADDVRGLPAEDRAMLAEMAANQLGLHAIKRGKASCTLRTEPQKERP